LGISFCINTPCLTWLPFARLAKCMSAFQNLWWNRFWWTETIWPENVCTSQLTCSNIRTEVYFWFCDFLLWLCHFVYGCGMIIHMQQGIFRKISPERYLQCNLPFRWTFTCISEIKPFRTQVYMDFFTWNKPKSCSVEYGNILNLTLCIMYVLILLKILFN